MPKSKAIQYPYIPKGRIIGYVSADNPFMLAAKDVAFRESMDNTVPTGSVIVLNDEIVGAGANGSNYHKTHVCERVKRGIPTGQGYELCEGCSPKNHSEPKAINNARKRVQNLDGASLYLWGHWWCCEPCWNAMIEAGISDIYLMDDSEKLFNKDSPDNIIGQQFTDMKAENKTLASQEQSL
jgi:deoxycytidylate deaminase